jgi:hypothetical protein
MKCQPDAGPEMNDFMIRAIYVMQFVSSSPLL